MAYTEFYVTKGSGSSDVNGGGPSLGTNDAPVDVRSNCSSDAAGTTITDDSGTGWANSSVDDWLCFDSAGSKDFTRITAISGNNLTVSPAVTASASGVNVNVGGAWATIDHAGSTITTSFVASSSKPPRVDIQYSATSYAENVTIDNAGSASVQIRYEGYESTPGDGCPNQNLPHIEPASGVAVTNSYKYQVEMHNVRATGAGSSGHAFKWYGNSTTRLVNCRGKAIGSNGVAFLLSTSPVLIRCWAEDSASSGFNVDAGSLLVDCVSSSAGSDAFYCGANNEATFIRCIADAPAGDCFHITGEGLLMDSCIGYGSTGGSGVYLGDPTDTPRMAIRNCIFYGNNQYGIECASAPFLSFADRNAFGGNTQGARLNNDAGPHDITLTGDPFTDAANGDFNLNDTAGAGALLRAETYDVGV